MRSPEDPIKLKVGNQCFTCADVRVVATLVRERDWLTMEELDMSISRSCTKTVMASRYSSPVMVTAPSVAVPTLVLRIVSIVVITEVAAAEFMVTVFIWISKNVATVSVVAVQLPPEKKFKCCVLGDFFFLTKNLDFCCSFSFCHEKDEVQ